MILQKVNLNQDPNLAKVRANQEIEKEINQSHRKDVRVQDLEVEANL